MRSNLVNIMSKVYVILALALFIRPTKNHSLSKRSLLFPRATVLQFTYGLTVPLVLPRRSINFSLCAQVNYNMPYNISNFTPITIATRENSGLLNISRKMFYLYVIKYLDSFGLDGEQCLLRSVCEIAEFPMHIKEEETLLEKIVYYIFTPSLEMKATNHNGTKKSHSNFVNELLLAEKMGYTQGKCDEKYTSCLVSIVDIFTTKYII